LSNHFHGDILSAHFLTGGLVGKVDQMENGQIDLPERMILIWWIFFGFHQIREVCMGQLLENLLRCLIRVVNGLEENKESGVIVNWAK